ncbi:hypothetical protein EV138_4638 [Kribbella voronezhensis]|uniref:Secreted protein n=1 Tax=Kribbella voronezhensis TaxID=2512212 RepID=A0A4R7THR9_9ACTN|nr:hypothetical protein [Kribbella voronezhensis]TDU91037.1 hypothetical protein EV138_4638 [Kribbella voronezhensis]
MTQTTSAPPVIWSPPPPPSVATAPAGTPRRARPSGAIQTWFAGTPGRMRLVLIISAAMAVLFGLAAAQGFRESDGALKRAEANTAQLVRIQGIHTNLVSANADATNAFLVGGLEPPAQRQHFVDSMAQASKLITEAATAQPADQAALGQLNTTLLTYQGLVEQARANNRQGLPIGSQYLKDASASLQEDSLPLLDALVKANESRVGTEFDGIGNGNYWLIIGGLVTLLVLAYALWWLAKRTHRYLNLPIAAAAALVLLTMVVGGAALSSAGSKAKDTRGHAYADTLALSRARIAAYDAKSNESLTLIARGSGEAFQTAWTKSAAEVDKQLAIVAATSPAVQTPWNQYKAIHATIRDLDAKQGKWGDAVARSVGTNTGTDAGTIFGDFDEASAASLGVTSTKVSTELSDARKGLPPIGWLGLPIGIVAALLVAWGMSQRLGEYR